MLSIYPGGVVEWELLWIQNIVLIFLQFTTGAALYSQDTRFTAGIFNKVNVRGTQGRSSLILVHAIMGVFLVVVNLVFISRWTLVQGGDQPLSSLSVTTYVMTIGIIAMAVMGVSMYSNIRPGTSLPLWRFDYALSRKLHRGFFFIVVAALGYHIFFTPRVYLMWKTWILDMELFGLLSLSMIVLWGVLAGHSMCMLGEWLMGNVFRKRGYSSSITAVLGSTSALVLTFGVMFTEISSVPLVGIALSVFIIGMFAWRRYRYPVDLKEYNI